MIELSASLPLSYASPELCTITGCSAASSPPATAPLPDDLAITPPAANVSSNLAAFSGAWLGAWGDSLPTALIVEEIDTNGAAQATYSWGEPPTRDFKAGWADYDAQISNDKLKFISEGKADIDFTLQPNGTLLGKYLLPDQPPTFAELRRVPSTNTADILAAAKKPYVGDWEEVRVPVASQVSSAKGKTLQLQTTIYRQPTVGKHPVVILNHGSTGPGIVPVDLVFRGGNEGPFFRSLGYIVVVPMRKGRGHSDGPHLEENFLLSSATQLDSAIEDLDAVIRYLRTRDDVDPTKIILSGVSRGGFLSVTYAGRYPTNIAGVINFSGGWFSEDHPEADFNFEAFTQAGKTAKVPQLWLYADHDSFYSLKFVEKGFSKFRDAGGKGELIEIRDLPGNGHMLSAWVDRWRDKVTTYLKSL